MKRLSLLFLSLLFLAGCIRDMPDSELLACDTPMLSVGGKVILSYEVIDCQLAFSREAGEFRVMKDNLSDYFKVTLSNLALSESDEVNGNLEWSTPEEIEGNKNIAFKVLKLEGDKIWLKSSTEHIALVLEFLE